MEKFLKINIEKDYNFLEKAKIVSSNSEDPSTKVGAILTTDNYQFLGSGFNKYPEGIKRTQERDQDRELRNLLTIHAEVNTIMTFLNHSNSLKNSMIFLYPVQPCVRCSNLIIDSGIKRVVSLIPPKELIDRWGKEFSISKEIFQESGIELILYPKESR